MAHIPQVYNEERDDLEIQEGEHFLTDVEILANEFADLEAKAQPTTGIDEAAHLPYNKCKNRYVNVLPAKETAVKLSHIPGRNGSDYINANFVQDRNSKNKQTYICSQAPLPITFFDFWRMVMEHNSNLIVMITREEEQKQKKLEIYWPESLNEVRSYAEMCVRLDSQEGGENDCFVKRHFSIWKKQETQPPSTPQPTTAQLSPRDLEDEMEGPPSYDDFGEEKPDQGQQVNKVLQIHFPHWPDSGVPSSTKVMRDLIKEVDLRKNSQNPIVVHCSAGIGRTGTFVAIHMAAQKYLHQEEVNIKNLVSMLRQQRPGMVQSLAQYIYIHKVVNRIIESRSHSLKKLKRTFSFDESQLVKSYHPLQEWHTLLDLDELNTGNNINNNSNDSNHAKVGQMRQSLIRARLQAIKRLPKEKQSLFSSTLARSQSLTQSQYIDGHARPCSLSNNNGNNNGNDNSNNSSNGSHSQPQENYYHTKDALTANELCANRLLLDTTYPHSHHLYHQKGHHHVGLVEGLGLGSSGIIMHGYPSITTTTGNRSPGLNKSGRATITTSSGNNNIIISNNSNSNNTAAVTVTTTITTATTVTSQTKSLLAQST